MVDFGRLITAMITPMDAQGNVDIDQCVSVAKYLEKNGSTALLVAGTTGESPVLSADEKREMLVSIKKNVSIPVIANVGTNSTAASIENIKLAESCGVDGLLAVVPYYNKPNAASQFLHFSALAEAASLPIIMYNIPGRTGINMTAETTIRLSKVKNIAGIKEASGNLDQLAEIVNGAADGFIVYTGEDSQTLPTLAVGGYGVISVASHVVGNEMADMIESYLKGNVAHAKDIHLKLMKIIKCLFMTANPIPVKEAMNLLGFKVGKPRLPLAPADETVIAALTDELKKLGKL
jgi:4-hydroxy-tetrahydrodipicolinate synthase